MSQHWIAPWPPGPDPRDPLVSGDFQGWWRRSFALLKAGWRPMAAVQAIVLVPTLVITVPLLVSFQARQREAQETLQARVDAGDTPDFSLFFAGFPLLLASLLGSSVLYLLGQLVTAQLVVHTATGRPGGLGPAVLAAARRVPALLGWSLLALPLGIAAVALCFLPVIYVGAVLTILSVVVLLERGNGIGRCFQLFHADLGVSVSRIATILGLNIAGALAVSLLSAVAAVALGGSLETPNTAGTVVEAVLQGVYSLAAVMVGTPLLVTAYADMRARREPFSTAYLLPAPADQTIAR